MACKFCTPVEFWDDDGTYNCASFPIVMDATCYTDSAELTHYEFSENDKLNCLNVYYGNDYFPIGIPVNYCPFCGEKLQGPNNLNKLFYETSEKMPVLTDSHVERRENGEYLTDLQAILLDISNKAEQAQKQYNEFLDRCKLY